jgi:hypothetical protein
MSLQLSGGMPAGVAGTGTTAMAGTALGIAAFDLLMRNRGIEGGLVGFGGGGGGVAAHEAAHVAKLQAEVNAQKEITALQIKLAEKDSQLSFVHLHDEIKGLQYQVRTLQSFFNIAPTLVTSVPAAVTPPVAA